MWCQLCEVRINFQTRFQRSICISIHAWFHATFTVMFFTILQTAKSLGRGFISDMQPSSSTASLYDWVCTVIRPIQRNKEVNLRNNLCWLVELITLFLACHFSVVNIIHNTATTTTLGGRRQLHLLVSIALLKHTIMPLMEQVLNGQLCTSKT